MSHNKRVPALTVGLGFFFACSSVASLVMGQADRNDTEARVPRLIQSSAEIASLPKSGQTDTVRTGFTPNPQSSGSTNYGASFYRQPTSSQDVYPYPTSNQPRTSSVSQSAFALSQGRGSARLSDRISLGTNTTGNISGERYAMNQPMAYNLSLAAQGTNPSNASVNSAASSRMPVEQQRSSTLDPVQQARINQVAVAQRQAYQNQLARQQQQLAINQQARASQQATAYRQSAYPAGNPVARMAQNCCTPNNRTSAGYQAAFQTPSIDSNVGAPMVNDGSGGAQGGFNQPALPQCCVPAAGYQGGYGGYRLGSQIGTPQFGAQGARWWTPFFTGSGVYRPLVNLAGTKPGTYLGQGIIGQPTAYVDGQPVRNLFRYLSP